MKIIKWLRSLKTPSSVKAGVNSSFPKREKVYRPLSGRRKSAAATERSDTEGTEEPRQSFRDQRRYPRYSTEGRGISAKMVRSEEVDIENLSIGGACILTKRTVTPGEHFLLNFAEPNIDRPLKCKVVWEREHRSDAEDIRSGHCRAGVQFREVPPYTLIRLKDFMRASGVPDMKKLTHQYLPSSLRFNIYRNQKASMKYPSTCLVRKISLGGMLIDTDQEYAVEQKYPMALYLPDSNPPIKCTGRIASQLSVRNERGVRYDTGVEFLNLADRDRASLGKFLSRL